MTSDPQSRKRPLSAEEADLWLHAMRHAKAMRRRGRERERAKAADAAASIAVDPAPAQVVTAAKSVELQQPAAATTARQAALRVAQPRTPPLAPFDERQRRKLGKDTDLIDARLDLHGMRQREAYSALKSFLRSCAARGMRHVLVITGKGTVVSDNAERDFFREERGVLRRLVPEWLRDADVRPLVVSYTTSHVRHGGEGALYVRLRKMP